MGMIFEEVLGRSDDPERSAREASEAQVGWEREALDYLKEREAVPQQVREEALTGLGDYFQVPGEQMGQQELIDQARQSPLYESMMGGKAAGEESILRLAGATGGLRSGNVKEALYDYNVNLENEALLTSFNQGQQRQDYERQLQLTGLQGLAGTPTNAPVIANQMSGIGQTEAQGIIASNQAGYEKSQQQIQSVNQMAMMAAQAFSDIRLKDNIEYIGDYNGHNWYAWDWNEDAKHLGLEGRSDGVMAHEIYEYMPEAIGENYGYVTVNYSMLEPAHAVQ